MRHLILVTMCVLLGPLTGTALGQRTWTFEDRYYYEALKAEPRAARISLIVPGWSEAFPFSEETGDRFAWQITLGRELPIVGVESAIPNGRFGPGQWGVGLWIPVSFHMIEDFKDDSNPIVNTDYRFGAMAKAQVGLERDAQLEFRLTPWAHESTHLGDEFTINAARLFPTFERVNVSYEYYEYGVSYHTSSWTIRHGGINLWGEDGYYSDHLLGDDTPTLSPSVANYEPSFGIEWTAPEVVKPNGTIGRALFVSLDLRRRLIYQFHRAPGVDERHQWSWSLAVGRALPEDVTGVPLRDYFLQLYHGVNPHGQLRSQPDYTYVGLGFTFGR